MIWLSYDCSEDTFFEDGILDCRVHPVDNNDLQGMKKADYHMQHNVKYFRNHLHIRMPLSSFLETRRGRVRRLLGRIHSSQGRHTVR